MRLRNAVWTINNYTESDVARLLECSDFAYICFGKEVGDSGTPHLQGYAEFSSKRSFQYARDAIGRRAYVDIRRGTQKEAIDYTRKECAPEDWFSAGVKKAQGQRVDLDEIRLKIKEGVSTLDIADEYFSRWCFHRKPFLEYRNMLVKKRRPTDALRVEYFWGATSCGKSWTAFQENPDAWWHSDGRWFDGYDPHIHDTVIFDDFDPSSFPIRTLLKRLRSFPHDVPIKGSFRSWRPKKIVITNNVEPQCLYPDADPKLVEALLARITLIRHFTVPYGNFVE